MKKLLSYLLCACLIMTLFSGTGLFSVNAVRYFGNCGYNLKWKYDKDTATLTISGTGAMNNYVSTSTEMSDLPPWVSFRTAVQNVVIENGLTSIGNYAFFCCATLKNVTIPDSVTTIGVSAFSHCTCLTSVTIGNGLRSIGMGAFICCTSLKDVIIPDSVTTVGAIAFQHCTGLTSVTIPDSVNDIGGGAFSDCTSLTNITIPDSITSIYYNTFYGCTGLTSVTIPDSVNDIGSSAFSDCTSLKDVYYTGTEQQKANITIDECANYPLTNANWHYLTLLKNAKPATCTEAGYTGDIVWVYSGEVVLYGEVIMPGHEYVPVTTAPTCTLQGYTTYTCSRCGYIYKNDYTYMPCGENCGFIIENNILYIHGTDNTDNYKTQTFVPWYDYADSITEIIIDEGITRIGNYAFYCLSNLKSIKSKNSNLAFGKYAINNTNTDVTVFAENGGTLEIYCAQNNINYIDPTITPEVETVTANSLMVKAVEGYEYSLGGAIWQNSTAFTDLLPAREYNIYARHATTADIFDTVGKPLNISTLKLTVTAPSSPNYKSHTDNSVTLVPNALYEFSIDGVNWQKSNVFTELSKNTVYRFYQRIAETQTEYASQASAPLIIAIPDKPKILEAGHENILVKNIDGFEYCLDDFVWQDSNSFDMLIDNTEYYVYQRLKAVDGKKIYQITSDYTAVITDNSISLTHTPGDIDGDGEMTNQDLIALFQHLSGWDVPANNSALDIDGDGEITNQDLIRLFQKLSGWDVEIF